jgi:hypothetical protein
MPLPALSLVGFMDERDALEYLRTQCICKDTSDAALVKMWQDARARVGNPIPRAGQPNILDIPTKHTAYLQGLRNHPRYKDTVAGMQVSFKQVEIAPLLAYQFHVHTQKSQTPTASAQIGSTMQELLQWCLPHSTEALRADATSGENGVVVTSSNINLAILSTQIGQVVPEQLTSLNVAWGPRSNLVQVVRYEGRCFLKNGYHRAYQLGKLNIKHIPCLLLEATKWEEVGALGRRVFPRELLESSNPPTAGHFLQHRAFEVVLPVLKSVIRVAITADLESAEE